MDVIVQTITIGGILAGAVVWICNSMFGPVKDVMEKACKAIDRLNEQLDEEQAERHRLEIRLQEIDDRGKSNTHRIDSIERKVMP
jgi:uncharacterized protein YqgV (UPF0045/DUF77 family)